MQKTPRLPVRLAAALRDRFPWTEIEIRPCTGLCSYYAERGGVIVGFETA